jgi:4-amino-4-deoxy-L-arabinose transferase-like glycosyltransferase
MIVDTPPSQSAGVIGPSPNATAATAGLGETLLATSLVLAWLAALAGVRALTSPEEARYAGVAWAMARSADWLTPMLDGMPFLDKPPLFYWLTAASFDLLGSVQWPARAAPLLGAALGAISVWRFVHRRAGRRRARWTLLALATSPLFFGGAQFANTDMLVAGCIALTITLAAESMLQAEEGASPRPRVVFAWLAAALGVLAKGLIGWVLPALVVLAWALATRRTRSLRVLVSLPAIASFLLVVAPWFIAQECIHPGFTRHFVFHHHLERFAGTGFNNVRGWWFYLVLIPLAAFPWSLWLLRWPWRRLSSDDASVSAVRALMATWLAGVALFFSIPQSKPIGYIMPVLFPLSFLAAEQLLAVTRWRPALTAATLGMGALASLGYVFISGVTYDRDQRVLGRTLASLRHAGDPVVFVDAYYYDLPIYARLDQPVPILGDWSDPGFSKEDDWRRELSEAAAFAPAQAKMLLVERWSDLATPCGHALWAVVPAAGERRRSELAVAVRIFESNGAVLWRFPARDCAAP